MPAHACARAPPLAAAAGRLAPAPGSGSGPGLGLGSGSGSGSLSGLVLFESGLTSMGCEHTHSAIRTGPSTDSLRYPDPNRTRSASVGQPTVAIVGSNHCNGSDRTVATFCLTGMGYAKHTRSEPARSAIRIRTGPLRYPDPNRSSWTTNSCDCSS